MYRINKIQQFGGVATIHIPISRIQQVDVGVFRMNVCVLVLANVRLQPQPVAQLSVRQSREKCASAGLIFPNRNN